MARANSRNVPCCSGAPVSSCSAADLVVTVGAGGAGIGRLHARRASLVMSIDGPVSSIRFTGGARWRRERGLRQHDERSAGRQRRGGLQLAGDLDAQRGQALLGEDGAAARAAKVGRRLRGRQHRGDRALTAGAAQQRGTDRGEPLRRGGQRRVAGRVDDDAR